MLKKFWNNQSSELILIYFKLADICLIWLLASSSPSTFLHQQRACIPSKENYFLFTTENHLFCFVFVFVFSQSNQFIWYLKHTLCCFNTLQVFNSKRLALYSSWLYTVLTCCWTASPSRPPSPWKRKKKNCHVRWSINLKDILRV